MLLFDLRKNFLNTREAQSVTLQSPSQPSSKQSKQKEREHGSNWQATSNPLKEVNSMISDDWLLKNLLRDITWKIASVFMSPLSVLWEALLRVAGGSDFSEALRDSDLDSCGKRERERERGRARERERERARERARESERERERGYCSYPRAKQRERIFQLSLLAGGSDLVYVTVSNVFFVSQTLGTLLRSRQCSARNRNSVSHDDTDSSLFAIIQRLP